MRSKLSTPRKSHRCDEEAYNGERFCYYTHTSEHSLSTFQNRIWFLHNLLEDTSALNFTIICHAHGKPKLAALQQAIDELIKRNEILRTAYSEGEEFSEQVVLRSSSTQIQTVDFSAYSDSDLELRLYTKEFRALPLDIERGKVMRLSLAKLSDLRYAMVFVFHHIAVDNSSTKSAIDQFTALYGAIESGKDPSLVMAPKISYSAFTLWHMKKLQSPHVQSDMDWWREKFTGAPSANKLLPFARCERTRICSSERSILRDALELPLLK